MCYLYILHNKHIDKYYVGVSNDVDKRLEDHNKNHSKKYTRKQVGSWDLCLKVEFESKGKAMLEEKRIKGWKSKRMVVQYIEQSRL